MSKKLKYIIGLIIIGVFLVVGFFSFMESKVEYVDFKEAANRKSKVEYVDFKEAANRKSTVQVKGYWVQEKESKFDINTNTFTFYMRDDNNNEMKVVLEGAKPNNFEIADGIVVKGKMEDGYFHAKSVLTKCPSKYESLDGVVKTTDM
jgi:cytochrome c-type biogenesis protein CcmE